MRRTSFLAIVFIACLYLAAVGVLRAREVGTLVSVRALQTALADEERAGVWNSELDRLQPMAPQQDRYVVLLSCYEGLSNWPHGVVQLARFASLRGRILVEPCVAAGRLAPCTPGRVGNASSVSRLAGDPLAVPRFADQTCDDPLLLQQTKSSALTWPLSIYFDLDFIANKTGAKIISFDEWYTVTSKNMSRPGAPVLASVVHCFHTGSSSRAGRGWTYGKRVFHKFQAKTLQTVFRVESDARTIFFAGVRRPSWLSPREPLPAVNPNHVAAVRRWISGGRDDATPQALAGSEASAPLPIAVFQWRSETVEADRLEECANALSAAAVRALGPRDARATGTDHSRRTFFIVSDIPSPGNPCPLWDGYRETAAETQTGSSNTSTISARRALSVLQNGVPLFKYDDTPVIALLDSGILALRDYVLGVLAEWYITCSPGAVWEGRVKRRVSTAARLCGRCFRPSRFVNAVLAARRAAAGGRRTSTTWPGITSADIPPVLRTRMNWTALTVRAH